MTQSPDPRLRPFFVIWTGQAISLVGSYAVQFALIWWVTLETESASMVAVAGLLGLAPAVLLGPLLGTLVDRSNRKSLMLLADGIVAAASAVLALAFAMGDVRLSWVFAALLVRGLGTATHQPAMTASTSLMVPEEHLTRIQGLNQALQGGLAIIGAPLGALLVATLSMSSVMWVDVLSALVAIVPLLFVRVPQPERSGDPEAGFLADTRAGFGYLLQNPGMLVLVALMSWVNLLLAPAFSLLPLFVKQDLNGGVLMLGGLQSTMGIGLIAGGIALGVWGGFRSKIFTALSGLIGLGGAVALLGIVPASAPILAFASMALVGVTVTVINGPLMALMQAVVPADFQGRVFALWGSIAAGMAPLGLAVAGPVAEFTGIRAMYLAGGAVCVVVAMIALAAPVVRGVESNAETGKGKAAPSETAMGSSA